MKNKPKILTKLTTNKKTMNIFLRITPSITLSLNVDPASAVADLLQLAAEPRGWVLERDPRSNGRVLLEYAGRPPAERRWEAAVS